MDQRLALGACSPQIAPPGPSPPTLPDSPPPRAKALYMAHCMADLPPPPPRGL